MSEMLYARLREELADAKKGQIDYILRSRVYPAHVAGRLSEFELEELVDIANSKRERAAYGRALGEQQRHTFGGILSNLAVKTTPPPPAAKTTPTRTRRMRSRDEQRKRWDRRDRHAFSGILPPHLRARYTPGEAAVLDIIGLTVGEIAGRAGVSERTVQYALGKASRNRLISVTYRRVGRAKNLPNIIRVVASEWLAWLSKRPKQTGCKGLHRSLNPKHKKEEERGFRKEVAESVPTPDPNTPVERALRDFLGAIRQG